MIKFKKGIFLLIVIFLINSCTLNTKQESAPVKNLYTNKFNTKDQKSKVDFSYNPQIKQEELSLDAKALENDYYLNNKKILYHEVQKGENIEEIAINYNQMLFDIIKLNNLSAPYKIKEKQILKIIIKNDLYQEDIKSQNLFHKKNSNNNNKISNIDTSKGLKNHSLMKPVEGKVIKHFGEKYSNKMNKGINILTKPHSKVYAATSGKVIYSSFDAFFGNLIIINTLKNNIFHTYGHLNEVFVAIGDFLDTGDIIGIVGKTGKVNKEQLYFSIRQDKKAINPLEFLEYDTFIKK